MGIPYSEFMRMTPRVFHIYADGYSERKELEIEEYKAKFELEQKALTYQAFLISRWVWTKKVDIEKYLEDSKKKRVMTDEQMLERVKVLNMLFGGDVLASAD